jgi:hypothetical protein
MAITFLLFVAHAEIAALYSPSQTACRFHFNLACIRMWLLELFAARLHRKVSYAIAPKDQSSRSFCGYIAFQQWPDLTGTTDQLAKAFADLQRA